MTRADKKFHKVLKEFENGELRSQGKRVTDKKQALAIAFSEARHVDKNYKPQKFANGAKIDNTLQTIFEDAWVKYIDFKNKTNEGRKKISFDEWLHTTNEGQKYFSRIAQIIQSEHDLTDNPIMSARGMKASGKSHANGGIEAIIVETQQPVEIEGGELIITKDVDKLPDVVCEGNPEAIASEINEMGGGNKISNEHATCHLKNEIMKHGKKIQSHIIEQKIKREQLLKNKTKMEYGAKISPSDTLIKVNETKSWAIIQFLFGWNFSEYKVFKYDDICIYRVNKDNEQMILNMDEYGIHYTEFDNEQELNEWLKNQLPQRIKNKIKQ